MCLVTPAVMLTSRGHHENILRNNLWRTSNALTAETLLVEFRNIFMARWVPLEWGKGVQWECPIKSFTV